MTTNLYFVRHAHSTYTPDEYGRPLSEQGVLDANKVTELLKTENMDLNFGRNSKCLTFINYHSREKSSYMLREYGNNLQYKWLQSYWNRLCFYQHGRGEMGWNSSIKETMGAIPMRILIISYNFKRCGTILSAMRFWKNTGSSTLTVPIERPG